MIPEMPLPAALLQGWWGCVVRVPVFGSVAPAGNPKGTPSLQPSPARWLWDGNRSSGCSAGSSCRWSV